MSDYTLRNGDRLHDADTIYPAKGAGVRLSLGDAPEVIKPKDLRVAAPGSAEATAATRLAIEEEGYAVTTTGEKDRYGRDLGTIAAPAGGPSAEQDLVADGLMMPGHWKSIDDGGASAAALQMRGAQELTGTKPSALQQNEEYQALVEQGRTARLDWLQERINSGRMREDTLYMAAPKDERKTEFQGDTLDDLGDVTAVAGRSWDRGVDNTQSTLYGFADALGSATGIDMLEKYGEEGVATNVVEAMRNPATIATYEDIEGLADFGIYALEAVAENSPQLLGDLAAGIASGGSATVGKYALAGAGKALLRQAGGPLAISKARELAAKGMLGASARMGFMDAAKAGSMASMYAQVTGETQNQLVAEGIDSPETALLTGIPKAALDYVGLSTVLRSGLGKVGFKAGLTPQSATELLGRTASSVGIAATTEGLTEATQTLMDELAIKGHKPDYQINMTSIIDAMLKGGIGGGTFAGAGAALTGAAQMGASGSQVATDVPVPEASTLPVAEPAPEIPAGNTPLVAEPAPEIPANNAPAQATAPEPLTDIQAQMRSTPEGEGNWYTAENAEQAKQVAVEQGKATLDLPDGSVAVGTPEVLATLPAEPTQADLAKLNGYAQTKEEAAADPEGTVVVEVRDNSGAVLRNQVVGKSMADEVVAAQQAKFPSASVEVTTAEAAVARRGQAVNEGDLRLEAATAGVNVDDFMESVATDDPEVSEVRLNTAALRSELEARKPTTSKDMSIGAPAAPRADRESAEQQPWQAKTIEAIEVAKALQTTLYGREEATVKQEGAHTRRTVAKIKRLPVGKSIKGMSTAQQREVVKAVNGLVGLAPYSKHRQNFVDAVREAMVAEKGNAERKVAAEHIYDEAGELVETVPTQAEALNELLDRDEEQLLDDLLVGPALNMGDWSGASTKAGDVASVARAELFLGALQRLVSTSEVADEKAATLAEGAELRVNQSFLMSAGIQSLMPAGASPKRFAAPIGEAFGMTDEDVRVGGNTTATVEEALAGMAERTDPYQTRVMTRQISSILSTDAAFLEAAAEAGVDGDTESEVAAAYLRQLLDDGATAPQGVAHIAEAIRALTAFGPVQSEQLLRQHDAMFGKGADRGITAQAEGAMNTPIVTHNEDESSEQSFFGALWDARAKKGAFRKGSKSITVSEAMNGRNLQRLTYTIHGHQSTEQFDMVALAMYAQGGEHAPSTPAEAVRNLLANIGRAVVGPMTRGVEHPAIFDALTLPAYNTVVFIDPVTGKGVTFGEASGQVRAARRQATDADAMLAEQAALSVESARLSELMAAMRDKLLEDARDAQPDDQFALRAWADALVDRKFKRPEMTGGQERAFNRVGGRVLSINMQKAAASDLGLDHVPLANATLRGAFSKLKSNLSTLKKLGAQLREVGAYQEVDEFDKARREVAAEMGDQYDLVGTSRAAEHLLRGSKGAVEAADRSDEVDPTTVTFFRPLQYEGLTAGASRARLDAVVRLGKQLSAEKPHTLEAKPVAVRTPAVRSEPLDLPARSGKDGVRVHGATMANNVVRGFTTLLAGKGVPLPAMDLHVTPQTLADVHASVSEADYVKVQEAWDKGGSFYLRNGDQALVVLRPKDRTHAELLLDLAHELGHAVKDQVWTDLNVGQRTELEAAFKRDTKLDASRATDDSLLHEWFADQFAQAALDETAKEAASDGSILGRIVSLAKHIRAIWQALTGRLPGIAPEFSQFAQALFAGGYAHAEGQASNINAVVRFADGAQGLQDAGFYGRATVQAKRFMQTGAIPNIASRVFRMVISRINGYSPELAGMLFQQAGKDASVHGRAWGQQSEAFRARMQGQMVPVVAAIEASVAGKATKRLAVRQAFQDAATGKPITAGGKQVRALMDSLALQARKDGLRSVQLDPGFTIAVFSREQVDKRRVEFETMLAARLGEGVDVKAAVTRIVEGTGVIEGAIAPGMPVGTHATTRSILEAIPFAELQAGGWLLDEPEAAMYHWIDGMAKRTAWDAVFGAHVEGLDHNRVAMAVFGQKDPSMQRMLAAGLMTDDGKVFDANAKYKVLMERIREQHGVSAAAEVQDMIDGAMGRHGQNMPGTIRRTYDAVVSWTGLTILAFSGLASIPELAMPLIRGGGKVKLGDVFRDIGQARQFSRDMGIVMSDMADRVSWQLMGEQYQSPMMQKITHQFFKWNGNKAIVDFSRYMAVSVAMRYLQSAAESGDHGALHRLNIDAATVDAWVAAGRPAWNPGLPEAQQGPARAAADAINQFVGEATLRPSRFQATNWGNNPWMKFIWQLKHFLYTYGDTVLGGIWRETSRRWKGLDGPDAARALSVVTPALLFGVFMLPLAAAASEARDWIRRLNGQRSQAPMGNGMEKALGYIENAFMRAGGLGPLSVLEGMSMAAEYDRSPVLALSPVLAKLEYLADFGDEEKTGAGKEGPSLGDKARSLIPVASQNKGLFSD